LVIGYCYLLFGEVANAVAVVIHKAGTLTLPASTLAALAHIVADPVAVIIDKTGTLALTASTLAALAYIIADAIAVVINKAGTLALAAPALTLTASPTIHHRSGGKVVRLDAHAPALLTHHSAHLTGVGAGTQAKARGNAIDRGLSESHGG
jgi:hypothetical protein